MKTLTKLYETFINAKTDDDKLKYVDEVWELLQSAYESQGGIKGSGFKSKEDMVKNIPLWKLVRKGGKIVAGSFYKSKDGRKRVAAFTNGTQEGKEAIIEISIEDIKTGRAYQEISGRSLSLIKKFIDIKKYAIPINTVKNKLKNDEFYPVDHEFEDDDEDIKRNPEFKDYFYRRKIGGNWHTKLMIGNINADEITIY